VAFVVAVMLLLLELMLLQEARGCRGSSGAATVDRHGCRRGGAHDNGSAHLKA
jgi:hypothetical protein